MDDTLFDALSSKGSGMSCSQHVDANVGVLFDFDDHWAIGP